MLHVLFFKKKFILFILKRFKEQVVLHTVSNREIRKLMNRLQATVEIIFLAVVDYTMTIRLKF